MEAIAARTDITIMPFEGISPRIDPSVFIAAGARIIGDVEIDELSSIWFNVVIRGDVHYIRIGRRTNVQDLVMCHVTNRRYPLVIGNDVTVGHSAVLHGATIGDRSLIGMGAAVLDNAVVGEESLVAAGTVVREGFHVPNGTLVAGIPGKVVRELTDDERRMVAAGAGNYESYVARFRAGGLEW
ncbi:MAG TPA: gamma carbonic anhydrase family protein [Candidatus Kapabacteria bacterium]|jgi:carbonic anhydrase/acetyltransferase-like protein (isoleucine patch superfamily)|nr:gamma carbonic anhydrase family protein [Candidatus Kapabacteria bacterium]